MYEDDVTAEVVETPVSEAVEEKQEVPAGVPTSPEVEVDPASADVAIPDAINRKEQLRQFMPYPFPSSYNYKNSSHLYKIIFADGSEERLEANSAQEVYMKFKDRELKQITYLGTHNKKIVGSEELDAEAK